MIEQYQQYKANYELAYDRLSKHHHIIGVIRLLVVLVFGVMVYYAATSGNLVLVVLCLVMFFVFVVLVRRHQQISWKRKVKQQLIKINTDEIKYLSGRALPFGDGKEFIDFDHFYAHDLDVFGQESLYHHLNRTSTYIGGQKLADRLLTLLPNERIVANQAAIRELSAKIEWRQGYRSLALMTQDNRSNYEDLISWSRQEVERVPGLVTALSYILPFLFVANVAMLFFFSQWWLTTTATGLFLTNLAITASQFKKIKREIVDGDRVSELTKYYGLMLACIESEQFQSERLQSLKSKLAHSDTKTSDKLNQLSSLFKNIQSVLNGAVAIFFSGALLYHLHVLRNLLAWKTDEAQHMKEWLDVIGEFELLNSLANLSFNNPDFIYPKLNDDYTVQMKSLGHPLIPRDSRICNDVSFDKSNFTILTGSNMSGKSTFLRTLGINMVLTGIGSCICAADGSVHPLPVLVSMRQADSLSDNESYFFAEIKRLQKIILALEGRTCFVLLDEILKGTNSEDKRAGTIEVIKKMISNRTLGLIATHDLAVCETIKEFPEQLENKCFEVTIIDDDLHFDYKLRDGICKNKSATFLMEKMDII